MLHRQDMHQYQVRTVGHILAHDGAMLHQGMGLGKSISTLTAISDLFNSLSIKAVLVVAPKRVVEAVWRQEAEKWSHTRWLRFSLITGSADKRRRAIRRQANIYLINFENLLWLQEYMDQVFLQQGHPLPFDMVVYDEISKLKNARMRQGTGRGKAAIKILPFIRRRVGLTGTPASNGLLDLFGQYLVVDGGQRLGTSFTAYQQRYFYQSDYSGYRYSPHDTTPDNIAALVGDITVNMETTDYLDMPDLITNDILLELPASLRSDYDDIETEMMVQLQSGSTVEVFNQASLINRTLQYANGAIYTEPGGGQWEQIHDVKLNALEDIVEEAAGQPIFVAFEFRHDAEKILKKFPKAVWFSSKLSEKEALETINDFKSGRLQMIVAHPGCLHPDTLVLTERNGWTKLIDVKKCDKVHDGVEFISHDGCAYAGYKEVISRFGITLTPNHKLLIGDEWMEAKDVRDCKDTARKALYKYEGDDEYISEMLKLRKGIKDTLPERNETQQEQAEALHTLRISQEDKHKDIPYLAWHNDTHKGYARQKLCRAWHRGVQRVEYFYELLRRYARRIPGRSNYRAGRCRRRLLKAELQVDNHVRSTSKQEDDKEISLSGGGNASCCTMQTDRRKQDYAVHEDEKRHDPGRGGSRCDRLTLREEHGPQECETKGRQKTHVYDLLNCGPRNRFIIKNRDGDVFISHNSAGHGIDGLQDTGHIMVWYGLNWSLDLYDQTIARLWRQGQKQPVMVHRLIMDNTTDLVVADSLRRKASDETTIKQAITDYWNRKT